MDGTLLNDLSLISNHTMQVLKKMTDCGHKLVLSSGRPMGSIMGVVKQEKLNLPGMYIVANNGSTVYDCDRDEIIMEHRVPMDMVAAVWKMCVDRGIHIQTYTADSIVTVSDDEEIGVYRKRIHLGTIYTDDPTTVLTEEPYKLLAISLRDKSVLDNLIIDIEKMYGDKITAIFSNDMYLEIINARAGKGEGLKWLCGHLGIPIEDAFAAGDAMNDLSMIQAAGNGIVMCNGDKDMMAYADIISKHTNDEDGLAEVIEKYIIEGECVRGV